MKKINKNQTGFSAVELILLIVLMILIGGAGYIVYKQHNKTKPVAVNNTTHRTTTPKTTSTPQTDKYTGWKTFKLADEKLSFKYPSTWSLKNYTNSGIGNQDYNADWIDLTSSDGFDFTINDGLDGTGDALPLVTSSPVQVTYANNPAYMVFKYSGNPGAPGSVNKNEITGFVLLTNPSNQTTAPKDKYIKGTVAGQPATSPGIMIISGGYGSKTFSSVNQAMQDVEYQNAKLVIESMTY